MTDELDYDPALVAWLHTQLDDDERKVAAMQREANRVRTAPIFQGHPVGWLDGVDIFVSPKRWQAEIDAKRRLIDSLVTFMVEDHAPWNDMYLRLLALPYADREGFRAEWRAQDQA